LKYYLHETPGRTRIKIPGLRGNQKVLGEVQEELMSLHGVCEVLANELTGSIVVMHDKKAVRSGDVVRMLDSLGHIDAKLIEPADIYTDKALSKAGSVVGKALFGMAVERVLAPKGLSFLAALL
jgi:hypothetical protein